MPKVYKIHPAIGIMRVGNADSYFVGPEQPGHPGIEIQQDGTEQPVREYKKAGLVKRQAARFRLWEYDKAADGSLTPVAEVSAPASIEWTVRLVNSKAAGNRIVPVPDGNRNVLLPLGTPRNSGINDRESLTIRGGARTLVGASQPRSEFNEGSFLGTQVYLGEAFTDGQGRLVLLGGIGKSSGIPDTPGGPIPALNSFANNDRWHDDVSDGPVTAKVFISGQQPVDATPAWVICAPPDFAPPVGAPVSLYEIAIQAAISNGWITERVTPSFIRDILPVLTRSLSLRWVHDWFHWDAISSDWASLSDPANDTARRTAFNQITQTSLHEYGLPPYLLGLLEKWRDGNFINDLGQQQPSLTTPDECDRAALEACIATSFYPGIEAGFTITNPTFYLEPFRLSHDQIIAGQLTAQMALPWQADFNDCAEDWWPSQRPNDVFARATDIPNNPVNWPEGVYTSGTAASRKRMVDAFGKLGFIVSDASGRQLESERDGTLPQH